MGFFGGFMDPWSAQPYWLLYSGTSDKEFHYSDDCSGATAPGEIPGENCQFTAITNLSQNTFSHFRNSQITRTLA